MVFRNGPNFFCNTLLQVTFSTPAPDFVNNDLQARGSQRVAANAPGQTTKHGRQLQ
jgi:hypothetical protein